MKRDEKNEQRRIAGQEAFDFFDSRRIFPRAGGVALRKSTWPVGAAGGEGNASARCNALDGGTKCGLPNARRAGSLK